MMKATSKIKEDHACFPPPYTSNDVHDAAIELRVTPDAEKLVAIYSLPATSTVVSATAKVSVEEPGTHVVTKEYPEWECDVCHAKQDAHTDTSTYDVMPAGFYDWPTTPAGRTLECAKWTGEMSKGLDRSIAFKVACKCEACEARFGAQAESSVDVHELYIKRNEYLGLDMTDDGKGKPVTREASAVIDPAPRNTSTYSWKKCGNCTFIGTTSEAGVTYGATSATKPSESRNDQELTVTAVVKGDDGQTASATCTNKFTVVKVDVKIGEVGEDKEESEGAFIPYVADTNGLISDEGTNKLVAVSFTCNPTNLPINEMVTVSHTGPGELYEVLASGELVLVGTNDYPACEIANRRFKLHGHDGSSSLRDGKIRIVQPISHAIDEATFTIFGIKTETIAITPANRTRKTIGVGEELIATFYPSSLNSVTWSVNGGGSIDKLSGNPITFTATNRASTATITAESNGLQFDILLSVIEPDGVSMRRIVSLPYPAGFAGAGMYAEISLRPTTVSFYKVETLEIQGPASDITGYFTNFPLSAIFHHPSPSWGRYNESNVFEGHDKCATPSLMGPWVDGGFVWHIPWHFRVGTSDSGKQFTVVDQEFTILADGTVEIRKAGATVRRVP